MNLLKKLAFEISMSFDISDQEKQIAIEASQFLISTINQIKITTKHLDIMKDAFEGTQNIDSKLLYEKRGLFQRYANESKKNFEKVKIFAAQAIFKLKEFEVDNHIAELINSLEDSVEQLEKVFSDFFDLLEKTDTLNFAQEANDKITKIKSLFDNLENIIKDRIIEHIDKNILSKNWLQQLDEKKLNPANQLLQEKQQAINNGIPETLIRRQVLNPAQTQQFYYPADRREPKRGE